MAYKGNGTTANLLSGVVTPPAAFTYHFMYKGVSAPSNSNNQRVFNVNGAGPTVDIGFSWNNTAAPQSVFFRNSAGNYKGAAILTSLSGGVWYAIGGRLDTSFNLEAFLNGVSESLTLGVAASSATTSPQITLLAAYGGTAEWDDGTIAEVGFWSVDLTNAEMAALGAGVSPLMIRPQSLLSYIPLIADTNQKFGPTYTNTGATVQTHPRIIYPVGMDDRRISSLTAAAGSVTRNVDFASLFSGGTPGFASLTQNTNFASLFETQNPFTNNVNFASDFTVPSQRASFETDVQFKSRFFGTTGVLANGRFRGRFYG